MLHFAVLCMNFLNHTYFVHKFKEFAGVVKRPMVFRDAPVEVGPFPFDVVHFSTNTTRVVATVANHRVCSIGEILDFSLDQLYRLLEYPECLRDHFNRRQRTAVAAVSSSQLTVKFIEFSVQLKT